MGTMESAPKSSVSTLPPESCVTFDLCPLSQGLREAGLVYQGASRVLRSNVVGGYAGGSQRPTWGRFVNPKPGLGRGGICTGQVGSELSPRLTHTPVRQGVHRDVDNDVIGCHPTARCLRNHLLNHLQQHPAPASVSFLGHPRPLPTLSGCIPEPQGPSWWNPSRGPPLSPGVKHFVGNNWFQS